MTATYTLPELPYDYGALEPHLSGRILELHHGKHHKAYVDGANAALERLASLEPEATATEIVGLERTLAFNVSGHLLHSLYWDNMAPGAGGEPDGELRAAIDDAFGSFARCKALLSQATVTVQGSGWGALVWDPLARRLLVEQVHDHHANLVHGALPLLVIDAWEHAYYLQYENRRADYVAAFWNVVNWPEVATRLERARAVQAT